MDEFLRQYGLWAVYVAMWFEGETVLAVGGFLQHQGIFSFWPLYITAVLGALTTDHAVYLAGRTSVNWAVFRKLKSMEPPAGSRTARLWDSWIVFIVLRFVYGTRLPFIFYVSHRGLSWMRFLLREVLAVSLWCFIWLVFGHSFGKTLTYVHGQFVAHHRLGITLILFLAGTILTAIVFLWKRRRGPSAGSTVP